MSTKISVSADFDSSAVTQQLQEFQQQLNGLGQQIASANKIKFEPVNKTTLDDMRRVTQQFEALKRVSGDLNKRINATGQKQAGFMDLDWSKLYPDQASRSRQMAKSFQYVTGHGFQGQAPGAAGGPPSSRGGGGAGVVNNTVGAGLRAAGPAGGVAANSLSTGMSAGFGAGLMGLMGGMLALGVSKAVGAAMENMGKAEDNAVSYDRLKRTLGDVNVGFQTLKVTAENTARRFNMTFDESAKLTTQFVKLSNVTADQHKTVANEMGVGAGMSRSFGLDNSVGVGVLGQMRGMRVTNNDQETRKMALLIGETIGKSNAFAKSDEVMEAISSFATSQTRQSMGAANVGGFAGQFSSMVGSGIPGMDPTGAAGLLSRINATLSSGGAAGEASQFFTSMIGQDMGLDVFQTQILREGGAFATNNEAFGPDSAAARFGIGGPEGDQTFMSASLDKLRAKYGHNPGLLAKATSEHLGVSMRQSMALLSLQPNQMGEMAGYAGDLTNLNAKGIAGMAKVVTGSDTDRREVADELMSRRGKDQLSESERQRLSATMADGSTEDQKRILVELVKTRDQEQSQGKDIHESKIAIENLKTSIADKLIPLTQNIRDGILFMAGQGEKTGEEVLREIAEKESAVRQRRIKSEFEIKDSELAANTSQSHRDALLGSSAPALQGLQWWKDGQAKIASGEMGDEEKREFTGRIGRMRMRGTDPETRQKIIDIYKQLAEARRDLNDEEKKALQDENARLREEQAKITKQYTEQQAAEARLAAEKERLEAEAEKNRNNRPDPGSASGGDQSSSGLQPGDGVRRNPVRQSANSVANDQDLRNYVALKEQEIGAPNGLLWAQLGVESSYNPNAVSHAGARGLGQIMPTTQRTLERRAGRKFDPFDPYDSVDMQTEVMKENFGRFGDWSDSARAYNGGWNRNRWNNPETRNYVPKINREMQNPQGTPLPEGVVGRQSDSQQRFIFDSAPIEIVHRNDRGEMIKPSQYISTSVRPASPFGAAGVA